jgi:hypothetical protein
VDWSRFAAVIVRSTWDYQQDLPSFLDVLATIASQTRLANPLEVMQWNADKRYLRELEAKGVGIVPTLWGSAIGHPDEVLAMFGQVGADQIVVKPTVSANADSTFWLSTESDLGDVAAAFMDRPFMVQPFMSRVLDEGEFSLFYFNGAYSHAILKTPKPADFRVQEEHGGLIQSWTAGDGLLAAGSEVMSQTPAGLLYARVDLVRDDNGGFRLMELELIEPALYLRTDAGAPERFARAIDAFIGC